MRGVDRCERDRRSPLLLEAKRVRMTCFSFIFVPLLQFDPRELCPKDIPKGITRMPLKGTGL